MMSNASAENKPGKTELVRAEGGRFAKGNGGGPGRPAGQTLPAQWRRDVDWEAKRQRLEAIAADPKAKHSDVIAAIVVLLDRAWGRPVTSHDVLITQAQDTAGRSFAHLTDEQVAERLAWLRGQRALAATEYPDNRGSLSTDDNRDTEAGHRGSNSEHLADVGER